MTQLVFWIRAAGFVQLGIAALNFVLPSRLGYRENLALLSTIVRQVFIVHSLYIGLILLGLSGLCLFFAPELASPQALGRCLSAFLAAFWALRVPIQLFYYDPRLRREHRLVDLGLTGVFIFLATLFTLVAWGVGR